jgi:hypothetical protein
MSDLVDDPGQGVATALDDTERLELKRLRTEVAALRAQPAGPAPVRRRVRWASVGAATLVVIGCLLVPLSLVAVWTDNQVSDTDRFVATTSPVISDPSVQAALADRITAEVFGRVDVKQVADQAIDALAAQGLPAPVVDRLHALTGSLAKSAQDFARGEIGKLVASPQFGQAFNQAVATSHRQITAVLSGESSAITIQGASAVLDLGVFIDAAKQRLVASGFELAARIPEIHPTVDLFPASTLVRAQSAYGLLDATATWLPWVTLLVLVAGVLLARSRRRAVLGAGVGIMVMMVAVAIGLLIVRALLVGSVPHQAAAPAAATFDIVVSFLRIGLRTLFVIGLCMACAGFLTGPSATAVQIRGAATRSIGWLRRGRIADALGGGPVGPWVHAHRRLLHASVVVLAALLVIFLDQPTGFAILAVAVAVVVLLGVIEFLNQPAPGGDPLVSPSRGDRPRASERMP